MGGTARGTEDLIELIRQMDRAGWQIFRMRLAGPEFIVWSRRRINPDGPPVLGVTTTAGVQE